MKHQFAKKINVTVANRGKKLGRGRSFGLISDLFKGLKAVASEHY